MTDGVEVRSDDLRNLAADLAETAPEIRKELFKRLRQAAKPIVPATRAAALASFPAGGGLNKLVAKAPQRITARAGRTSSTVAVQVVDKRSGAFAADQGAVRHPVFGNRAVFAVTKVDPFWFTDTAAAEADARAAEVEQVMDDIARKAGFR